MNKKTLFAILSAAAVLCGASDKGLLMRVNYDGYSTIPDKAVKRMVKPEGISHELQLRMFPGINDKGNAVCLNNPEFVSYPIENFAPDCGTVMIWVSPQNWSLVDTKYYQSFVEVRSGKYRFIIFKPSGFENGLCFYLQHGKIVYSVRGSAANWKKGEWHHLAAVWNNKEMKLYVDGKLSIAHQKRTFERPIELPKKVKYASLWVNQTRGWRHNPKWQTAYDEFNVYNRCLTAKEIAAIVEKHYPSDFKSNIRTSKMIIPQGKKITLDGVVSPAEWQDATAVPIANQMNYGRPRGSRPLLPGIFRMKYDDKNLYAAFEVKYKPSKTGLKGQDAKVWTNDSFDIFMAGKDGKSRQFAVSAGGGYYDSLEDDPKWNSSFKTATRINADSWSAEFIIPLKDLGNPRKGDILYGNFGSSCFTPLVGYHSWSFVDGFGKSFCTKELFGQITFGSAKDAVRYLGPGAPNNASVNMRLEGNARLKGSVSWLNRSGERATPHGNFINKTWESNLAPGEVIVSADIKDRSGKELLVQDIYTEANRPLSADFICLPSRKTLDLILDFSAAGKKGFGSKGVAVLKGRKDGKVYDRKEFVVNGKEVTVTFPFDSAVLPANSDFLLEAEVAGMKTAKLFRTPDMKQFAPVQRNHDVPHPWHKVDVNGKTVKVLDRIYSFDNGPIPSQIVTRNDKVIGKQPNFVYNNTPVKWEAAKFGKNHGDYVEVSGKGSVGKTAFECRGELWFDGMYKFTVSVVPNGKTNIKSLRMKWQTPTKNARYVLATIHRPWEGDKLDMEWNTAELYSSMWTTGILTGLAWWCESDANWHNPAGHKNIHLRKGKEMTDVTIDLITIPAATDKKFSYTMVLQGTPPRRPEPNWRNCNYGMTIPYSNMGIGWASGRAERPDVDFLNYTSLLPINKKAFERHYNYWAEKRKIKVVCYTFPPHLCRFDREYDVFFQEWASTPGTPWRGRNPESGETFFTLPCCGHGMAGDLFAGRVEKLFQDHKNMHGVYYDISHVVSCSNPHHGHGGVDIFGKKFTSSNAMSMRSYFLQIYKLHKKYNRIMWLHAHNKFYPFVHDFAELWAPGEEQHAGVVLQPFFYYMEKISFEEYQSAWNSDIRGVAVHMIPQEERACGMQALKAKRNEVSNPTTLQHSISPALLHDFKVWETAPRLRDKHPLVKVWAIKSTRKMELAKFHGYWFNSALRSNDPKIYGSWYSWEEGQAPLKRLLIVVNASREPKAAKLIVDWKALGVDPAKVQMTELWNDQKLTVADLKTIVIRPNGFILIELK